MDVEPTDIGFDSHSLWNLVQLDQWSGSIGLKNVVQPFGSVSGKKLRLGKNYVVYYMSFGYKWVNISQKYLKNVKFLKNTFFLNKCNVSFYDKNPIYVKNELIFGQM